MVLAGAACGLVFMFNARYQSTLSGLVSRDLWIPGWLALLHTTQGAVLTKPVFVWWMVVPAALGIIATLLFGPSRRPLLASRFCQYCCAVLAFCRVLAWTRANVYVPRYILNPALFLLSTAAAGGRCAPCTDFCSSPDWSALAATALMFVAAVFSFGRPSLSGVEARSASAIRLDYRGTR